jgi:tryptophan-rich sensory protein
LLLTPYALWVAFATILNAMIVRMNPPFSGQARGKKAA